MSFFLRLTLLFLITFPLYSQQMSFVENNGFSKDSWKYILRSPKSTVYFYDSYFVIQTFQQSGNKIVYENIPIYFESSSAYIETNNTSQLESKTYRFLSDTRATSSSHFESIIYRNISKNVDCRFFIYNSELRFDFVVKEKSVRTISLSTSIGNSFTFENSKICLSTNSESKHFLQDISLVYPYYGTVNKTVSPNKRTLKFNVPIQSDFAIIDPTFSFASFLGGSSSEYIYDVKILDNNRMYAVGYTTSLDFPTTPGVHKTTTTSADIFVYALDLNTNSLLFSTYIGGTNSEIGYGIDIASNTIIICGQTNSLNFPVTPGAFSTTFNGGNQDGFVTGLSINGNSIPFSSYIGGTDSDVLNKLAVNNQGSIIACGMSRSTNFPLGSNPAQFTKSNGNDGVIISLSPTASAIFGGTFLGGNSEEKVTNLSISSTNEIAVIGTTSSSNFPLQQPIYPTYHGGLSDAFVSRYNQNLSTLLFSTYYGGSNDDNGNAISFDSQNNIIFGGTTSSINLPTLNEIYKNNRGGNDAFLAKILPNRTLDFSTYLGGTNDDNLEDLAVNAAGNIYITGFTTSNNFPLSKNAPFSDNKGSGDMFISKLYRSGQSVLYSTYYGDLFQDVSTSLSINSLGTVGLGGYTQSSTLQTLNAIDSTFNGGFFDAYLMTFFLPDETTSIVTDSVKMSYCRGTVDSVSFSFIGGFERNNSFVVELSDSNGNFTPGRVIGTLQSPNPRHITFFIPLDVVPSELYKIRVKSSSPSVAGTPTSHSIRINSSPKISLGNDTTLCLGNQIEIGLSLHQFPLVQWFSSDTTIKNILSKTIVLSPKKSHKYWAIATDSNGCIGVDTIQIIIQNPPKSFLPNSIQFCETDTIIFKIPDSLLITNIIPNSSSVSIKDSLILFHTNEATTIFITIFNKKNGCSLIDTLTLSPLNLEQVNFTTESYEFPEKQECEQYSKGVITMFSSGSTPITIDSIVIDNSAFSFDSLLATRKKNQFIVQPSTQLSIPIYFLGNSNQNSVVRIYSSKCILSDSILLSGSVDKNTIQIPNEIIQNITIDCSNKYTNISNKIPIVNLTNSRKIIKIDTNNISTIKFDITNYVLNSKDSIFIEYYFRDSLNNQSETIVIFISDSVCSKNYSITLKQNITIIQNEYSVSSFQLDTVLCDTALLKVSIPINKILRSIPNNDTLFVLNTFEGIELFTQNNQTNSIELVSNDSIHFLVNFDQLQDNLYTFKGVIYPCKDTIEFTVKLNIEKYSSSLFSNYSIQEISTNDSVYYSITIQGNIINEINTISIALNSINNIKYNYDSLQTITFSIPKKSLTMNDVLLFKWGKNCLFSYTIPLNKPTSTLLYSLDTLSALPGDTVMFTLRSEILAGVFPIVDTVTVSTNKYLLFPLDYIPTFDADTVRISIPHTFISSGLSTKSIRFLALLGDTSITQLGLHSSTTIPSIFTNGQYKMIPICEDREIFVKENTKNIFVTLHLSSSEYKYTQIVIDATDSYSIELFNTLGQKIATSVTSIGMNEYEVTSLDNQSQLYFLILRNSKNSVFIPIMR